MTLQARRTVFLLADQWRRPMPTKEVRREQGRMQAGAQKMDGLRALATWSAPLTAHLRQYTVGRAVLLRHFGNRVTKFQNGPIAEVATRGSRLGEQVAAAVC